MSNQSESLILKYGRSLLLVYPVLCVAAVIPLAVVDTSEQGIPWWTYVPVVIVILLFDVPVVIVLRNFHTGIWKNRDTEEIEKPRCWWYVFQAWSVFMMDLALLDPFLDVSFIIVASAANTWHWWASILFLVPTQWTKAYAFYLLCKPSISQPDYYKAMLNLDLDFYSEVFVKTFQYRTDYPFPNSQLKWPLICSINHLLEDVPQLVIEFHFLFTEDNQDGLTYIEYLVIAESIITAILVGVLVWNSIVQYQLRKRMEVKRIGNRVIFDPTFQETMEKAFKLVNDPAQGITELELTANIGEHFRKFMLLMQQDQQIQVVHAKNGSAFGNTQQGIALIIQAKQTLRELHFENFAFPTDIGIHTIVLVLNQKASIVKLSFTAINTVIARRILQDLQLLTSVKELGLVDCGLTNEDIPLVQQLLTQVPRLEILDLGDNSFDGPEKEQLSADHRILL